MAAAGGFIVGIGAAVVGFIVGIGAAAVGSPAAGIGGAVGVGNPSGVRVERVDSDPRTLTLRAYRSTIGRRQCTHDHCVKPERK